MIASKARLAVELSRLATFDRPSHLAEQYPTDSEIAAEILWDASFKEDILGKTVADLGCGTGVLGIGALLLGARNVFFVDADEGALAVLKKNLAGLGIKKSMYTILHEDVRVFDSIVDVIFQNPPFGTRKKHADRAFLEKAFRVAPVVYSFHKATTGAFVKAIAEDHHFAVSQYYEFDFPIKAAQLFHKRRVKHIRVGCWRLEKVDLHLFAGGQKNQHGTEPEN